MKNYRQNTDSLSMPWTISPFFSSYLKNSGLSKDEKKIASDFNLNGYVIIDLNLDDIFISDLLEQVEKSIKLNSAKNNSSFFSYNSSPRVVDAGKNSPMVVDLALNRQVNTLLKLLYRREPIPFSTINFRKGTEQPLHSDTIHFGSIPKGYLAACWVALEDTDSDNGALRVVEGSHKLQDIDYSDLNIRPARNMKMVEDIYRDYEKYVVELIDELGMKEKIISMKKGTALIWSANLLHGGSTINDPKRTRYSQVTHYNFEGCKHYYHPFFSIPSLGKYINRNIKELDIRKLK